MSTGHNKILIETQYLPPISYFQAIGSAGSVVLERHEHYNKQTYRNRCHINTQAGREKMFIPLALPSGKVLITDVRIDYSQRWVNNHWRTIQSAYGKAPFFEYYADDLHTILFKNTPFLYDLNCQLLSLCLKWLKWNIPITESPQYEKGPMQDIFDMRNVINAKKNQESETPLGTLSYPQVFGNKFVPDLSVIDCIFCTGPEAVRFVRT